MSAEDVSTVYEAVVTGVEEKKDYYGRGHPYTYYVGGILVRPPVEVGERLKEVVLAGIDKKVHGPEFDLVISTENGTLFRALTEGDRSDIDGMSKRVAELANHPELLYQEERH
jgi:hypothetical protein